MQTTSNMEILSIATRPTTTPFPALNEEERSILSRIIYLTPPNTNNFNVLLSPYENTLRRSRIDPKIDDKYYTLLLKLSLIPGKDWKQKWARVESDQPTSSAVVSQQQQPAIPVNPSTSHPRKIIEKVHASSYDEEDRGALIKNFRPPPVNHQKADRRPQKSVHFLPSGVVENPRKEINDQPERDISSPVDLQSEIIPSKMTLLIDPIDVKARKFRRHQLLSRILTKWMHSIIYWNTLNSEAHSARRILDISARYQTWTRKFRNREDRLKSVDTTYNTRSDKLHQTMHLFSLLSGINADIVPVFVVIIERLMSLHLDQWRRLTVSRRIQKRSLALRNAYRKTKGTRERNLCRQVLIVCLSPFHSLFLQHVFLILEPIEAR
jgi:protein SFI1